MRRGEARQKLVVLFTKSPFAFANEISDQSKSWSLEFTNSASDNANSPYRDVPFVKNGYPEISLMSLKGVFYSKEDLS